MLLVITDYDGFLYLLFTYLFFFFLIYLVLFTESKASKYVYICVWKHVDMHAER